MWWYIVVATYCVPLPYFWYKHAIRYRQRRYHIIEHNKAKIAARPYCYLPYGRKGSFEWEWIDTFNAILIGLSLMLFWPIEALSKFTQRVVRLCGKASLLEIPEEKAKRLEEERQKRELEYKEAQKVVDEFLELNGSEN